MEVSSENDNNSSVPSVFTLENAYPNPFNPSTSLKMYVPASGKVVVNVYNASGKLVEELYSGFVGNGAIQTSYALQLAETKQPNNVALPLHIKYIN